MINTICKSDDLTAADLERIASELRLQATSEFAEVALRALAARRCSFADHFEPANHYLNLDCHY